MFASGIFLGPARNIGAATSVPTRQKITKGYGFHSGKMHWRKDFTFVALHFLRQCNIGYPLLWGRICCVLDSEGGDWKDFLGEVLPEVRAKPVCKRTMLAHGILVASGCHSFWDWFSEFQLTRLSSSLSDFFDVLAQDQKHFDSERSAPSPTIAVLVAIKQVRAAFVVSLTFYLVAHL